MRASYESHAVMRYFLRRIEREHAANVRQSLDAASNAVIREMAERIAEVYGVPMYLAERKAVELLRAQGVLR